MVVYNCTSVRSAMLLFTVVRKNDDGVLFVSPIRDKKTGNRLGNNEGLRGAMKSRCSNITVRDLWMNRATVSVVRKRNKKHTNQKK